MSQQREIEALITRQAQAAGINPAVAISIAQRESSLNPNAKNKRSSAYGLFQLTDARRRELGIPVGAPMTVEEQVDAGIRSLVQSRDYLERRLDREPQAHELYAAHFSGPSGSLRVLKADPDKPIRELLSRPAIRANPKIKDLTAGQLIEQWRQKIGDVGPVRLQGPSAPVVPESPSPAPEGSPMDFLNDPSYQLWAQQNAPQEPMPVAQSQEPVAFMAEGGEVGDDEGLAQMIDAAKSDEDYRRINAVIAARRGGVQAFSGGGEANAEPTAEELERASRAAFGVYPSSGRGRQQGSLSRAVQSGEALTEAAKGATMLPYNLVGAPVDLATLAMRPFGYSVERPVMGSEWLKERARSAGVAFPEPQDPALRGFYAAGDIGSSVVNPAGATRAAVRGAQRAGQAARTAGQAVASDPAVASAVERAVGRAAPVAAPMYAVRPRGGGISAFDPKKDLSQVDSFDVASSLEQYITRGIKDIPSVVGINSSDTKDAIRDFWKIKGVNYVTRQMGTPDDPILDLIMQGKVTSPKLRKDFMQHTVDSAQIGKTRVNPQTGETRFFPKYPDAIEALTRTYDDQLNVHPFLFTRDASTKGMSNSDFRKFAEPLQRQREDQTLDQLISQGVSPDRANVVAPAVYGFPRNEDALEYLYSGNYTNSPAPKSVYRGNVPGGETDLAGKDVEKLSSEALRRAVIEGETIYDFNHKGSVRQLLDPGNINEYLATLPPKEIIKLRFEDAVKDSAKYNLRKFENEMLAENIRLGKRVPEKFFEQGVSMPLLQVQEGPLAGFAFKRIEKPEATTAEGAWVGHSVGGYAQGGRYGPEAHRRFLDGKVEVYSLRDNRNRPVTTIEVKIGDDGSKKVSQIKGNGKFTGNTAPVNYDAPILQFLQDYLKPAQITESDIYLTPLLQSYKNALK